MKVVYTVITNDYDNLKEPNVITKGWEYICFTDQNLTSKTWKIVKIGKTSNQIKEQRRKKIYNEYIFENYSESIYVDGSMLINCDIDLFIDKYVRSDFSLMKHPSRDCIYQEAQACMFLQKDNRETIINQMKKYKLEGLPQNVGMVATGLMYRKHTKEVKEFCKSWWNEVNNNSIRDQLSFNYVDWLKPIRYATFPYNVLKKEFIIYNHKL